MQTNLHPFLFWLSEVIIHDTLLLNTNTIQIVGNSLDKHWRSAEVVLAVLGCLVVLQIGVADAVHGETGVVLHAQFVGMRILTVE